MQKRVTLRGVKAKVLGPALCRRLHLVPDEKIEVTVTRRTATTKARVEDPWLQVKGILSAEEADKMLRMIIGSRRSKAEAPRMGEP